MSQAGTSQSEGRLVVRWVPSAEFLFVLASPWGQRECSRSARGGKKCPLPGGKPRAVARERPLHTQMRHPRPSPLSDPLSSPEFSVLVFGAHFTFGASESHVHAVLKTIRGRSRDGTVGGGRGGREGQPQPRARGPMPCLHPRAPRHPSTSCLPVPPGNRSPSAFKGCNDNPWDPESEDLLSPDKPEAPKISASASSLPVSRGDWPGVLGACSHPSPRTSPPAFRGLPAPTVSARGLCTRSPFAGPASGQLAGW